MPFTLFEKCKWKKWLEIDIKKWKWNEKDWKSRSRSESEMKKLRDRDREVKFLENFREFKKDRFWSIGKGAFGGYIISLCNLLDQREGGGGRCLRLGWNGGGWGQRSWRNGAWGILWRSRGRAQWWGRGGRLIPDFFDNKVNSFEDLFYSRLGSKAFNVCLTYPRDTGPKSIYSFYEEPLILI